MVNSSQSAISVPSRWRLFMSALRHLTGKALTIFITIFVGVFITILVVNFPTNRYTPPGSPFSEARRETLQSPFAQRLESQIEMLIRGQYGVGIFSALPDDGAVEVMRQKLRAEAGLDLPYLPQNLLWTYKALTFNWGELNTTYIDTVRLGLDPADAEGDVVLTLFPNTLLLVGTAYLLVFLIGLPLALYLARNHGGRFDRLITVLSPISSVPSWVFAILLVAIFAVELRWLPRSGMYDAFDPSNPLVNNRSVWVLLKHMILPVTALVLSLLFQLIYAWRTFFIIYSEEDYVELARAKGLKNQILERQYILRPALPFIITSFTTSLIGFWQLTVALETVFKWPGIGSLYIEALPNYWRENVSIGDLMIVIQIVVIFAYLLGMLVFVLDLVYVTVDPRIHLVPASQLAQEQARVKTNAKSVGHSFKAWLKDKSPVQTQPVTGPGRKRVFSLAESLRGMDESLRETGARFRLFAQELRHYPSAIFGLMVILILLSGSLYAVLALPYEEFGSTFDHNRVTGRNRAPRVAAPEWFNYFSATPRLSAILLEEESPGVNSTTRALDNGWTEKTIIFDFEYDYAEMPSDVFLYLDPTYDEKLPFVSMTWTTPDGQSIDLKSTTVGSDLTYDFSTGIPASKLLNKNTEWKEWFKLGGQFPQPVWQLLFAEAGMTQPTPQHGKYQLKVTALLFEENSDLHPQLVLLGQVYGWAGTDYWRRDLVIPLFWGMPFALFVGLIGTFITTVIAMLLPAIGVWYGGWLDNLIQRLTEVNMVLPGLAIVVLTNLLFGVDIWVVLGGVVLLNAFGSPVKSFRSAFLQAKEAPYIEMARSYGASDFRIIARYLVPRILPVFIPQLVTQIPGFIFLEATLGFFNINSVYPSWGRIIYEGLSQDSLYGSPFWVLEPICLLLLTGLAFAMLGSALERILNPRLIDSVTPSYTAK